MIMSQDKKELLLLLLIILLSFIEGVIEPIYFKLVLGRVPFLNYLGDYGFEFYYD